MSQSDTANFSFADHAYSGAAFGDLAGQRAIYDRAIWAIGNSPQPDPRLTPGIMVVEAIAMARLCVAHGEGSDAWRLVDALLLGAMLMRNSGHDHALSLAAAWSQEAAAVLRLLAQHGDELAADASEAILIATPEEVHTLVLSRAGDVIAQGKALSKEVH